MAAVGEVTVRATKVEQETTWAFNPITTAGASPEHIALIGATIWGSILDTEVLFFPGGPTPSPQSTALPALNYQVLNLPGRLERLP